MYRQHRRETTVPFTTQTAAVLEAMQSLNTESDRWTLSDALLVLVPSGVMGFHEVNDAAVQEGVTPMSVNTQRLYRDTAKMWPASERVENMSFSAHREAVRNLGVTDARRLLLDLQAAAGTKKVTASAVRKAAAAAAGLPNPVANNKPSAATVVLGDLAAGGKEMVAAVRKMPAADLDAVALGLNAVLVALDKRRAAASKRGAATRTAKAKELPANVTPMKKVAKAAAPVAAKAAVAGDLRDF
jgi:hypothetical protein